MRALRGFVSLAAGAAVAAVLVLQGCGGGASGDQTATIVLGAYTTPRELYGKHVIPAFKNYWKERTGRDVEFQESYQGSGAQARAVVGGFEADIVALSLEADVETISKAGLITHDWRAKPHGGMFTREFAELRADIALFQVGADRERFHLRADFQRWRHGVQHRLHDRRHARHHDHVADAKSRRTGNLVLDEIGTFRNPRHAEPRLV